MKRIIPLFAFALHLRHLLAVLCGTGVSPVLAVSMSSSKIDTFMTLPDWMPTSVDAEHTFGSDAHSNASHRVTADTLAAVESIFDAYHERVFFTSEGRSNDWDVAEYGPRPTSEESLKYVNLTNFPAAERVWAYASSSTDATRGIRATPDTRRLVEFDNLIGLSKRIRDDFFGAGDHDAYGNYGELIFMRYRPTWTCENTTYDERRIVMLGSSLMPGAFRPDTFDWRDGFPTPDEWTFTNCCIPFAECAADAFLSDEYYPSPDNLNYFHRKWLGRIDCGELEHEATASGGESFFVRIQKARPWLKNTVGDLITSNFPNSNPCKGIDNHTRRMIVDDKLVPSVTIVTNVVLSEKPDTVDIDFIFERPRIHVPDPDPGEKDSDYVSAGLQLEIVHGDYGERIARVNYLLKYVDPYTGAKSTPPTREYALPYTDFFFPEPSAPDGGCDDVILRVRKVPMFFYSFVYDFPEYWYYYGIPTTFGGDWYYDFSVDFVRYEVVTNSVSTNSSLVATLSRALAIADRTYEIAPRCEEAAGYPHVSETRRTVVTGKSRYVGEGPVTVTSITDWEGFGSEVMCKLYCDTAVGPYSWRKDAATNEVLTYTVVTNTDLRMRYRGETDQSASYGCNLFGITYELRPFPEDESSDVAKYYHYLVPRGRSVDLVSVDTDPPDQEHAMEWVEVVMDFEDFAYSLHSISLEARQTITYTTAPTGEAIDRLYPYYGPGNLGFGSGRVDECWCSIACCIASACGWYSLPDIESSVRWSDIRDIGGRTQYAVSSAQVARPADVIRHTSSMIIAGGQAQERLMRLAHDAGYGFDDIAPPISLVGNLSEVGYIGAEVTLKINDGQPSTNKWPQNLTIGLVEGDEKVAITTVDPEIDSTRTTPPFAADILITDPLISTQWKWKALGIPDEQKKGQD